jgi:hypothetical protein
MRCPWSSAAAIFLLLACAPASRGDAAESAVLLLRRAIVEQRQGSDLALLFPLRQLHDPALRPVFLQLIHHDRWQVQVHAVLGLAELDSGGRIDPWLVTQLSQAAREAAIANAIDMKLLGPDQAAVLLAWPELEPLPRILLLAEQHLAGAAADAAALARLAAHSDDRVAGLAAALLAQSGDTVSLSTLRDRLATPGRRDRAGTLTWLFEAIRQYRLTAMAAWLDDMLDDTSLERDARHRGVLTLLHLDPQRGLKRWRSLLDAAPSTADEVRAGLLLLAASPGVPAEAFDLLTTGDELVKRMAAVGRAICSGGDAVAPMAALLELGHARTASWAMTALESWPPQQARAVYLRLLDDAARPGDASAERASLAATAVARLFTIDPAAVTARLEAAEDDGPLQQIILLGLSDTPSPEAGTAAGRLRRIGAGTADSLALLLIARHAATLDPRDLRQLGMIASGGARIAEGGQVKAAWLFLKHSGRLDSALADILAQR